MVRTTLTLPADLLTAVDDAVREGRARSRGELISAAVRHELAIHERIAIDEAFAAMSSDETYLREAEELTQESAYSGWEALRVGERRDADGDDASG
ncbi:MAG: ribbon-helix-helix domain-containing protein [Dehalococcoidia bacterium]